ncbi:Dormancy/auxin associated family protein isoform 2 [Hibiscus syriacus]|uniref:Dormancy/auxin associated family protein isoform 2 n=1 Tax=Hibiscus syriacus TaxID=106335 RepID=A0A6A2YA64_HIBSY|nr:dormancy-associated protein homolog 3-like isoform X2 [Hibiscus syriacus]KAE8668867.1 Dormancy/auxin associated family protein isoform 2 [Hibiscus syriacus]
MGLLDQLWDDIIAGPPPDNGLGKLRKYTFRRPNSAKESDGGSGRSYGDETSLEEAMRVTRTIMIVKPPGYQIGSPPVSPSGSSPPASPAGTSPPVSPFSGSKESFRFRRRSTADTVRKIEQVGLGSSHPAYNVRDMK